MTHYFCYQCERAVSLREGGDLQCPRCASDFLEELGPNDPRLPAPQAPQAPQLPHGLRGARATPPQGSVSISLMDLLNPESLFRQMAQAQAQATAQAHSHATARAPSMPPAVEVAEDQDQDQDENQEQDLDQDEDQYEDVDSDADSPSDNEEHEGTEIAIDVGSHAEEMRTDGMDGRLAALRRRHAAMRQQRLAVRQEENADDDEDDQATEAFRRILYMMFAMRERGAGGGSSSLQNLMHILGPSLGMYGNPGDYATDQQFDDLISRMMDEKKPNFKPASEDFINHLEKRTYTASDGTLDCAVCREDFTEGETYTALPCSHLFHHQCIASWLKENSNCPLCRKQFDANPTSSDS